MVCFLGVFLDPFLAFLIESLMKSQGIAYSQEKCLNPEICLLWPQNPFLQIRETSSDRRRKWGWLKAHMANSGSPCGISCRLAVHDPGTKSQKTSGTNTVALSVILSPSCQTRQDASLHQLFLCVHVTGRKMASSWLLNLHLRLSFCV